MCYDIVRQKHVFVLKNAWTKSAIIALKINIFEHVSAILTVFETFKNIDFQIYFTFSKTVFNNS